MEKTNLSIKETVTPEGNVCKSGHCLPNGIRFFHITGDALPKDRWGIYCEPCLKTASILRSRKRKQQEKQKSDSDVIQKLLKDY